uniref:Cysteine-rich receptor-like protein kinase n=1 Tax=Tanacetum cinerariifolium TaxID=118510 RepID=A0A699HH87_TANCI|nr:cysteine-rich receptor-like protein kinase [Tanacetum cinerariifolium]
MNVLSLNVKGIGVDYKRSCVKRLCSDNKINFLGLQESMSSVDNRFMLESMWGHSTFNSVSKHAEGKSGGIIAVWDTSKFSIQSSSNGNGFLAVMGNWIPLNTTCVFIIVYAPQDPRKKKQLWLDLKAVIDSANVLSLVMGDFNVVRSQSERIGSNFCHRSASAFNEFISSSGLFDLPMREIKDAVWDCGGDKAPGPDGFSFKLIKKHWNLLGSDIVSYVHEFYHSANIPRGCNSSFITLVPKIEDPITITDFRPISLIGFQYKIIAKVLENCLALVIPSLVGEVQMAFIKGRQITDGPLLVNKIISWAKKHNKKLLLLKVDFEKAFDCLSWSFLDSIMMQMGFCNTWRKWIHSCLSSAFSSILVNGSPTKEFKIEKGLRQGDPLSPFLFILAVEALNVENRKIAWIAWDKVISPLNQGGLGIGSLKTSNQSLLAKWWWRFLNEENALWRKVIVSIHGAYGGLHMDSPMAYKSGPRLKIINLKGNDSWECTIDDSRLFTVKGMRKHITNLSHTSVAQPFRWNKALPIKINVFPWRASQARLLTRSNLDKRDIDLNSTCCPVCDDGIETEEHLFISCIVAKETWLKLFKWWKIHTIRSSGLHETINLSQRLNLPSQHLVHFDVVVQTTQWSSLYEYFHNLNTLWKQYDAMPTRSNILTREPLPLVKTAFAVISGEDSHRNVTFMDSTSKAPSATAFAAKGFDYKNVVKRMLKLQSLIDDKSVSNSISNMADTYFGMERVWTLKKNFNGKSNFISGNISIGWVVDSGANQHMIEFAKFLINVVDVSNLGLNVGHPNDTKAKIVKIRDLKLNDFVTLFNVFVVPEYTVNL